MSDDRRTTVETLPGDPAEWLATLRDVLRYVEADSPDTESLTAWWRDRTAADGTPEELMAFLDAIDVLDHADGPWTVGRAGREFLDSHDERVLYSALTDTVAGFEPLLESLAVRPLTDVEFMDLLNRAFDAELESPEAVHPHREWLQALGYVTHDDGINELTRAGRRLVKTDDELTPPGADTTEAQAMGGQSASEPASGETSSSDTPSDAATGSVEPTDDDYAESLRERYDDTCMVCGDRRRRTPDEGYSLVHHPMPLAEPHDGPAEPSNAVVVCPNHRADFEHGLLTVDPQTLAITHAYEPAVDGHTLATTADHDVGAQYLAYHNNVIADF
ncbi:MAG: hypothetical protein ACI8UR_000429 [Natronomonas sp.]|jgi:hypothetical protein|uniref:hypothetical protein n=1 Tax=Natronomonas sp. TaxID=2184060 RepID=UPI003988DB5E